MDLPKNVQQAGNKCTLFHKGIATKMYIYMFYPWAVFSEIDSVLIYGQTYKLKRNVKSHMKMAVSESLMLYQTRKLICSFIS